MTTSTSSIQPGDSSTGTDAGSCTTPWDKVYFTKLEKSSGYDSPRPLWLFFYNGMIVYTLNSANLPKMIRVIGNILSGQPKLSEVEPSVFDFTASTVNHVGRRKMKKLKHEQEKKRLTAEKRKQQRSAQEAAKPVIERTAEWLVISSIGGPFNVDCISKYTALLVVYSKDESSGEFLYYNQSETLVPWNSSTTNEKSSGISTEQQHQQLVPQRSQLFTWPQSEEEGEWKFVSYNSGADDIQKGRELTVRDDCHIVADGHIHIAQIQQYGENDSKSTKQSEYLEVKMVANRIMKGMPPSAGGAPVWRKRTLHHN